MATATKKAKNVVKAKLPHKVTSYVLRFAAASAPVILYTAAREEKVELHQYHSECNGQIKRLGEFCPTCNGLGGDGGPESLDKGLTLEEVRLSKEDIYKGYDAGGNILHITEDEIEAAKPDSAQAMEVLEFVDEAQIDAVTFDASFYLAPDTSAGIGALRMFALLRSALEAEKKVAVARMVKSRREYLAFIKPYGEDGMILFTAFMADEVRQMAFPELPELQVKEIAAGRELVRKMSNVWDATKYENAYRKNLNALIEAKKDGKQPPKVERKTVASAGDDLMATLKASLAMVGKSA